MLIDRKKAIRSKKKKRYIKRKYLNTIILTCCICKNQEVITVSKIEVYTDKVKDNWECWRCKK